MVAEWLRMRREVRIVLRQNATTRVSYAAIRYPALRSTPHDQTCRLLRAKRTRDSDELTLLTANHEPSTYTLPFTLAIGSHALLQNYQGDVRKLAQLNFDAVKFDGKPAVLSAHCAACSLQLVAHRMSGVHTAWSVQCVDGVCTPFHVLEEDMHCNL